MDHVIPEAALLGLRKAHDGPRDAADGGGKDDGHDAGHIHLHGQVGALAAILLPAHHALGVLDGDAALRVGDIDDEGHDGKAQGHDHDGCPPGKVKQGGDGVEALRHDAHQQDHGDTVADALFRDLIAQPHGKHGAGHKGADDHDGGPGAGAGHNAVILAQHHPVGDGHDDGQGKRGEAGDPLQLLFALLALLLGHALQGRDGHLQQLDDDGAVDIGIDAQCKDRGRCQAAAGKHIEVAQQAAGRLRLKGGIQRGAVHEGDIDRMTEAIDYDGEEDEGQLFTQLRDLPRVSDRLDHFRSPPPFLPRLRSFPLRRQ